MGEGVHAGEVAFLHAGDVCFFRTSGVDDDVAQEAAGGVYGGPAVSGAGDADAGETCPFHLRLRDDGASFRNRRS